jgi:hypothetical protein
MKKTMVLIGVAAAFLLSSSVAFADPAYLSDVMKEPAYRKAYAAMLSGASHLPSWLKQITGREDYVGTPETSATVAGISYRLFHACEAHDCMGHELEVMFSPDGAQAYGLLVDGNKPQRWFGAPDAAQQAALSKALAAD